MSAYWAVMRSVTFSPPPPIRIGGRPCTGGGLSLPQRFTIVGQRAVEVAQPVGRRAELVAVLVVVAPEPAGTDAEDEAAAGDVVDGARHVGLQVRVAVGVAGDQAADLDAAGRLRHRRLHRPGLEVRAVRIAVQRVEVIPVEHGVRAHLLHPQPGLPHLRERALLRLQLDTDADRSIGHAGDCIPGR